MWYGSLVFRHGRSRPWRAYQASSRWRNRRRSGRRRQRQWPALFLVFGRSVVRAGGRLLQASRILCADGSVKIYTRTGDTGETSLYGGVRVSKADSRVEAYGEVDELNAWLGLARASALGPRPRRGSAPDSARSLRARRPACRPGRNHGVSRRQGRRSATQDVTRLEQLIDRLETELPPLRHFILAGGSPDGATLHLARTVCRRVERRIVALQPPVDSRASALRQPSFRSALRHRPRRQSSGWRFGRPSGERPARV